MVLLGGWGVGLVEQVTFAFLLSRIFLVQTVQQSCCYDSLLMKQSPRLLWLLNVVTWYVSVKMNFGMTEVTPS